MNKFSLVSLALLPISLNPIIVTKSHHQAENIKSQSLVNYQLIDWNEIQKLMNRIISNFANENKDGKIENFLINKTNQIISQSKNERLNLSQLINKLSEQSSDFKNNFKQSQQKNINLNFTLNKNISLTSIQYSQEDLDKLKKMVNDLKISRVTFTTIAATAAVAAAGFWAAAPFTFGATVPWATACTVISTVSGGVAAGLNIALVQYDQELNNLTKAGKAITSTYYLGHIFYRILKPLLIGASASIGAASWAFPAALALLPITTSILAWIELYQ